MPSEARASRVVAAVREGLCAWALAVYRWPRLTLLVGIIAAGASVLALAQLSIDSNIMLLLAPQQPSVRALARYRAATGGLGAHIVLARSSGGAAERTIARRFISVLARNLRGDPLIEHVASGDPVAFFEARSAYYLSLVELRRLRENVAAVRAYHERRKNPLFVPLDDPPRLGRLPSTNARQLRRRYEAQHGAIAALVVWPAGLPSDMAFVRRLLARVAAAVRSARHAVAGAGQQLDALRVSHHGSYAENWADYRELRKDVIASPVASVALLLLLLAVALRSVRGLLCALLPLTIGLLISLALAHLGIGRLNSLTVFAGSVLLGLGVDFGLHWLLDHRRHVAATGERGAAAVAAVARRRGFALLASALTTATAFFALCWTQNRGFREFGLIAGVGVLVCFAATLTFLPALLALVDGASSSQTSRPDPTMARQASDASQRPPRIGPTLTVVGTALLAVAGALLLWSRDDLFEYRLTAYSNLYDAPGYREAERALDKIFSHRFSPVLILARRRAPRLLGRARAALERVGAGRGGHVRVLALGELVPPRQREKHAEMQRLASELRALRRLGAASIADKRRIARALSLLSAKPFGPEQLPSWLRRRLQLPGGERALLLYSDLALSDGRVARRIASALRPLAREAGAVLTGEVVLFAELLDEMRRAGPSCLALATVAMLLLLRLLYGRWRDAALVLAPVAAALLWTVLVVHVAGLRFGLFNMVVLPLLVGIGVDDNLHLVDEVRRHGLGVGAALRRMRWPIVLATATTMCGFLGFVVSANPGLRSVGVLGAIGFVLTLAATFTLLPALLRLLRRA